MNSKEFYRNIFSGRKSFVTENDGYDDDDDDDFTMGIDLESTINNEYTLEYTFEVLSTEEIVQYMLDVVQKVSSVIQIPTTTTRILLNYYKWDEEKLLERFFDGDQKKLFEEAHVINPFTKKNRPFTNIHLSHFENKKEECGVCFTEFKSSMMTGMECGHRFCIDCWSGFLTSKIRDEGETQTVHCISCKILIDDATVMRLVKDPQVKLKYQHLITNSFIECNRLLKWCPSPGCDNVIKVQYVGVKPVTCKCNHTFCYRCGETWHDPVGCDVLNKWTKKSVEEEESCNWIASNTKKCPRCQVSIEKNGGCNHIQCRSCLLDFCWICFELWAKGGHNGCNAFRNEGIPENIQERSQAALKKYLFYWERYNNHLKSLEFEQKLYESINLKTEEMYESLNMSRNEVQFLKKAVDVLCSCRQTLMYTYVFANYIQKTNQSIIFENNQNDLETATECLSEYLERDITKENLTDIKQRVQDKSRYCEKRRKVLLEHVHEGYDKKWWDCLMD